MLIKGRAVLKEGLASVRPGGENVLDMFEEYFLQFCFIYECKTTHLTLQK